MKDITDVIEALTEATQNDKISWEKTDDPSIYIGVVEQDVFLVGSGPWFRINDMSYGGSSLVNPNNKLLKAIREREQKEKDQFDCTDHVERIKSL